MTVELGVVLALLAAAIVMFAVGRPRMDAVALLMLTALPFTGVVSMSEALAGFADAKLFEFLGDLGFGRGLVLGGYQFSTFKSESTPSALTKVTVVSAGGKSAQAGIERGLVLG